MPSNRVDDPLQDDVEDTSPPPDTDSDCGQAEME